MNLAPDVFWKMTPKEFNAAYRGHLRANGFDPDAIANASNLRAELEEVLRRYESDDN